MPVSLESKTIPRSISWEEKLPLPLAPAKVKIISPPAPVGAETTPSGSPGEGKTGSRPSPVAAKIILNTRGGGDKLSLGTARGAESFSVGTLGVGAPVWAPRARKGGLFREPPGRVGLSSDTRAAEGGPDFTVQSSLFASFFAIILRSVLWVGGGTAREGGRWARCGAATGRRCGARSNFGRFTPRPRTDDPKKRSYWRV